MLSSVGPELAPQRTGGLHSRSLGHRFQLPTESDGAAPHRMVEDQVVVDEFPKQGSISDGETGKVTCRRHRDLLAEGRAFGHSARPPRPKDRVAVWLHSGPELLRPPAQLVKLRAEGEDVFLGNWRGS